ncbi:histone-lysine N-methyltransferase SETMAR [Trichonephila clavipes]|nr:histone-lysine N-methyltransferase SETMAR [Trichonephila clavipes]
MARRLENWSRLEVRAVIRYLWTNNVSAPDIHSQIEEVEDVCSPAPRVLSDRPKAPLMMCSLLFLQRYHSGGQHFVLTSIKATMEWKHHGSPVTKKFKVTPCAGKVMATIFWDSYGVILIDYLERVAKPSTQIVFVHSNKLT